MSSFSARHSKRHDTPDMSLELLNPWHDLEGHCCEGVCLYGTRCRFVDSLAAANAPNSIKLRLPSMQTRLCVPVVFCRLRRLLQNVCDGLLDLTIQKFSEYAGPRPRCHQQANHAQQIGEMQGQNPQIAIIDWIVRDRGHARQ